MGRQFKPGQLQTGSLYNISSSFALTASFALNGGGSFPFSGSAVITGSLYVSGSGITGSLLGTASYATNALSASYITLAQTASYVLNAVSSSFASTTTSASFATNSNNSISSSYALSASYAPFVATNTGSLLITASISNANITFTKGDSTTFGITVDNVASASYTQTASYAPAYLPLSGGTVNGNVTINGTASIAFLNVTYESASVIYSSGSNQFGDATNDIQTLIGTVLVSGSQQITGSLNVTGGITGSLQGAASDATGISSSITNNTNNNILTATGTGVINGEYNLTFDSQTLTLTNGILTFAGSEAGIGRIQQSPGGAANGSYSHAQGLAVSANGNYSHAEGSSTNASGFGSHAEGSGSFTSTSKLYGVKANTITSGVFQLAGDVTAVFAPGNRLYYNSAAYPDNTTFVVDTSVFGGVNTTITLTNTSITDSNFSVGSLDYPFTSWAGNLQSVSDGGHAEGYYTTAVADWSHAEGYQTQTFARYSHAEGLTTQANGTYSHAEGRSAKTFGQYSHAEGRETQAKGDGSHAEGYNTVASGSYSHVQGQYNISSSAQSAFIIGNGTADNARSNLIFASGSQVQITGSLSNGSGNIASGIFSHAEGSSTTATGNYSHAEGLSTTSTGNYSHAEGESTTAGQLGYNAGTSITSGVFELNSGYGNLTSSFSPGVFVLIDDDSGQINGTPNIFKLEVSSSTYTGTPATQITLVDTSINTSNNKYRVGIYGNFNPPLANLSIGNFSHTSGESTHTVGLGSSTEGSNTEALGYYSHAEGSSTISSGVASHAEGESTTSTGYASHAEGSSTTSTGNYSHAEGESTTSTGNYSHAEGYNTISSGSHSHAEGRVTTAIGSFSHAEGNGTTATGIGSHAEGNGATSTGDYSHAEGNGTITIGDYSHAEGNNTQTGTQLAWDSGISSGIVTINSSYGDVSGNFSVNDTLLIYDDPFDANYGKITTQISQSLFDGTNTIVELYDISITTTQAYVGDITQGILNWTGNQTIPGIFSHTEGTETTSIGNFSHAEGRGTTSTGDYSHAEGQSTTATGYASHAEGINTIAVGDYSHAEGRITTATGVASHAEGYSTTSTGDYSHAEGESTTATGNYSHAEGLNTIALGSNSHAEGLSTVASGSYQHVQGQYNISSSAQSAFILGNGTADNARSNLIFASGSQVQITGSLIVSGSSTFTNIGPAIFSGSVIATSGFTGSLLGTASYATQALSASYATNGGVTQIIAGPNITVSPTTGVGQVTISSTGGGGGTGNTATGSYGSFYDTTIQTNVASTARSMSLNTTDITNGVSISGSTNPYNTYIKTENAGVYDIQFSAQVDKTDSGTDEIWIWIRKNGSDVTDSATSIQLVGNGAHYVAAWNFFVNAAANDYFQLMWYSPDANVRLHAEAGFGVVPGIPSLIVTANRVDQFLSNTGSFSGSFTGNLIGTASYATQALSASYAITASYATNALSASYAPDTTFPYTGSAGITGSLTVVGPTTSTQIGAGAAPSGSVPLDVRAQGALSTDIAFRVRNSANTSNIFKIQGDANAALGETTDANQKTFSVNAAGNSRLVLGSGYSTDTGVFSLTRRYFATVTVFNDNALLLSHNSFSDGNNIPYKHHYVNPSTYYGSVPSYGYNAGFMWFKDSATIANLQMKLSPDNALSIYTSSASPIETIITGSAFQLWASGSLGNAKPYIRTQNGTIVWLGDESRLFNVTASRTIISSSQNTISGSSLTVYGSGSAQPVFTVQGSQGELFSITDSLSGSLFSVNDISGLPIMEVFSDNTTLMGSYLAPSLNTTAKVVQTNSGSFTMYSLPTASYDTAFFEYSVRSGSNARAGTIMAIQSGSAVNFTETTTTDFGSTSAVSFTVIVTGSNIALTGSSTSGAWTIKTIVRSI